MKNGCNEKDISAATTAFKKTERKKTKEIAQLTALIKIQKNVNIIVRCLIFRPAKDLFALVMEHGEAMASL